MKRGGIALFAKIKQARCYFILFIDASHEFKTTTHKNLGARLLVTYTPNYNCENQIASWQPKTGKMS